LSGFGYGSLMLRMVVGSDSVATSAKIQEKEREKKLDRLTLLMVEKSRDKKKNKPK